jgi:DNA-binding Lrp family transcriptional regulator
VPRAGEQLLSASPPDGGARGRVVEVSVRAYVLIQTEVGKAETVVDEVRMLPGVVAADDVTGPYDVIVVAEADTVAALGRMVVSRVQLIAGITRTLTCPVVDLA